MFLELGPQTSLKLYFSFLLTVYIRHAKENLNSTPLLTPRVISFYQVSSTNAARSSYTFSTGKAEV